MPKVYVVRAEHPFQSYHIIHAFATPRAAEERAAQIVNDILDDFWPIFDRDEPQPIADRMSWEQLVEQYGFVEDFVQDDRWGEWEVAITPLDIET